MSVKVGLEPVIHETARVSNSRNCPVKATRLPVSQDPPWTTITAGLGVVRCCT